MQDQRDAMLEEKDAEAVSRLKEACAAADEALGSLRTENNNTLERLKREHANATADLKVRIAS